ncbi:hypothetical protein Tco_0598966 [Tanacetum coccineum]
MYRRHEPKQNVEPTGAGSARSNYGEICRCEHSTSIPLADILALTLLCLTKRFTLIILILYNLIEGAIYSVTATFIQPNKEDFRVMRFADFMLEFDGDTRVRKSSVKSEGFNRYPFQFVEIDDLEPTNNKYLIDAVGYVTSVGRTTQQRTGSTTLDFHLANRSAVEYPILRYRLELEISDDTTEVVVVLFDETTRNTHTDSRLQDEDEHSGFPATLIVTDDLWWGSNSDMGCCKSNSKTPELKRLNKIPLLSTPSKPTKEKKHRREKLEDSDAEESFVADSQPKGDDVGCSSYTRKKLRVVLEDSK